MHIEKEVEFLREENERLIEDSCDLAEQNGKLQAQLAIAVEALEEMRCSCYPYHKKHDCWDCNEVIAKEALAKIRS